MKIASENTVAPGTLYVVGTPIGNLGDFSPRAIAVLCGVDLIFAEDTRVFRKLAQTNNIQTQVQSYHDHNESARTQAAIAALQAGSSIALVSDAGTPTISDPGYRIVAACREYNIPISPIPGACAAIAALSVSGLPVHRFTFAGFLPTKSGQKTTALRTALESHDTHIFYESNHRIVKTLALLNSLCPEASVCVCRELTKLHEEIVRGTAAEVHEEFSNRAAIKGEIVLLLWAHEDQTIG